MNLLLVNDIALEADTMKAEIPWEKYHIDRVFTAYSANEARKILSSEEIDILLSDIEMPGEDGLSLIRWIRQENYDIDCILLTCHADFSYARDGISLNIHDYILLPAKYEDIGESVAMTAERRTRRLNEQRLQDYGRSWLQSHTEQREGEQYDHKRTPKEIAELCVQYVLEHIGDEELSVADIAAHLYLNPMYLNRLFKKEKGDNLSQWIIRERMELASALLRTTDRSAVDIAAQVGYANYPYFSTVFKKYFNRTPSQYASDEKGEG